MAIAPKASFKSETTVTAQRPKYIPKPYIPPKYIPPGKHRGFTYYDGICVHINQKRISLYPSPENFTQDEGWFPYYFDSYINKEDVLAWLRKLNLPDNLFQIETRIVYPFFKPSYTGSCHWKFDGFSKVCLEKASPKKEPLLTKVKSNAELLFDRYVKNKPFADLEGFFITTDPNIASTGIPKAITVLCAPSMIRNKKGEPSYLRNIINMAKLLYPDVRQTGYYHLKDYNVLQVVKNYHNDQIKLPHLIVMEKNGDGARACTWGNTDINELLETAKQIIQQGYVSDPENPLVELENGNPFIAIKYHKMEIFLDNEGNVPNYYQNKINRIQEVISKGYMPCPYDLSDDVTWNRIQFYLESSEKVSTPDHYKFKWVEIADQFSLNGKYWKLQAHHSDGIIDMAAIKRSYTGEDFDSHTLFLYLMGPAFLASGNRPEEHDLIEHSSKIFRSDGSKTKTVDHFKITVEEKVKELLNSIKEKAQEAA